MFNFICNMSWSIYATSISTCCMPEFMRLFQNTCDMLQLILGMGKTSTLSLSLSVTFFCIQLALWDEQIYILHAEAMNMRYEKIHLWPLVIVAIKLSSHDSSLWANLDDIPYRKKKKHFISGITLVIFGEIIGLLAQSVECSAYITEGVGLSPYWRSYFCW